MGSLQGKCVVVVGRGVGIARAVALFALTSTFMTGMTLKVDGGEPPI